MEFRVLCPFEVRRDGRAVDSPGGTPRAVLAAELLDTNEPANAERLPLTVCSDDTDLAPGLRRLVARGDSVGSLIYVSRRGRRHA